MLLLLLPLFSQAARAADIPDPALSKDASIVVLGVITNTEEIWDRRTNPLMGRPDVLKEIIWRVQAGTVYKCDPPLAAGSIRVSITGEKNIIKYKRYAAGAEGLFYLAGENAPFNLVSFSAKTPSGKITPVPALKITPRPAPVVNRQKTPEPAFPENISGRDIIKSKELQKKAAAAIAKKYSMKDASFVSMTSFSGPVPPEGGYIYWGVKGLIKGKWHIWQHGCGSPREGTQLEDQQRFNKCNSPDTMISTPYGAVAIRDLKEGDLVLSAGGAAVLIIKTTRVNAYEHGYTYDILPDSETGIYYANGIPLGSTITEVH